MIGTKITASPIHSQHSIPISSMKKRGGENPIASERGRAFIGPIKGRSGGGGRPTKKGGQKTPILVAARPLYGLETRSRRSKARPGPVFPLTTYETKMLR